MIGVIKSREEIARGTYLISFQLDKDINFIPGQYFFITLNNPPYIDKKGNRRHFTIVNSPNEKQIIKMATRFRDSAFKKSLIEIPFGTSVEIGPIMGDFILPEKDRELVFIAGGIGITPFMSMLTYIKEKALDYKITLIYSNRDKSSTPFMDQLNEFSSQDKNLNIVYTMTEDENWKDEKRRIDKDFISHYVKGRDSNIHFVSGPPAFVKSINQVLIDMGINSDKIKTENFSGY